MFGTVASMRKMRAPAGWAMAKDPGSAAATDACKTVLRFTDLDPV
jgi:hypothetical protein